MSECPGCGEKINRSELDSDYPICTECGCALTGSADTIHHADDPTGGVSATGTDAQRVDIPGFEVVRVIGEGGMGCVLEARQMSIGGRRVAIKCLPERLAANSHFIERFHQEAEILGRLSHPNIVAIYDCIVSDSGAHLVMEYVEGPDGNPSDLSELIAKGELDESSIRRLMLQVLDALSSAHQRGVVHRDIKPSNVMIDGYGNVKVVDFGIASIREEQVARKLTVAGGIMGTVEYMSPEQTTDARQVDARSDVYSCGILLYEMLTGRLPKGMFQMPSRLVAGLAPAWDVIVQKAVQQDPENRYSSASEMADAIRQLEGTVVGGAQSVADIETELAHAEDRSLTLHRRFGHAKNAVALLKQQAKQDGSTQGADETQTAALTLARDLAVQGHRQAEQQKDYSAAIEFSDYLVKNFPEAAGPQQWLAVLEKLRQKFLVSGQTLMEQGDIQKAMSVLETGVRRFSKDQEIAAALEMSRLEKERLEKGEQKVAALRAQGKLIELADVVKDLCSTPSGQRKFGKLPQELDKRLKGVWAEVDRIQGLLRQRKFDEAESRSIRLNEVVTDCPEARQVKEAAVTAYSSRRKVSRRKRFALLAVSAVLILAVGGAGLQFFAPNSLLDRWQPGLVPQAVPTANNDDISIEANGGATDITADLLGNDTAASVDDTLAVTAVDTTGTVGTVTLTAGVVSYDPSGKFDDLAAGGTATDTFSYSVADDKGESDTAIVTITVESTHLSPTADDDVIAIRADTGATDVTAQLLANDTAPSANATLSISDVDTTGTVGSVTLTGGVANYDPGGRFDNLAIGETATDIFAYSIDDAGGGTDTATVTVTIEGTDTADIPPTPPTTANAWIKQAEEKLASYKAAVAQNDLATAQKALEESGEAAREARRLDPDNFRVNGLLANIDEKHKGLAVAVAIQTDLDQAAQLLASGNLEEAKPLLDEMQVALNQATTTVPRSDPLMASIATEIEKQIVIYLLAQATKLFAAEEFVKTQEVLNSLESLASLASLDSEKQRFEALQAINAEALKSVRGKIILQFADQVPTSLEVFIDGREVDADSIERDEATATFPIIPGHHRVKIVDRAKRLLTRINIGVKETVTLSTRLREPRLEFQLGPHTGTVSYVSLHPDGRSLAMSGTGYSGKGGFYIHDLKRKTVLDASRFIPGKRQPYRYPSSMAFSPDGSLFGFFWKPTADAPHQISLLNSSLKGIERLYLPLERPSVTWFEMAPKAEHVIAWDDSNKTMYHWDLAHKEHGRFGNYPQGVGNFCFTGDGQRCLIGSRDGQMPLARWRFTPDIEQEAQYRDFNFWTGSIVHVAGSNRVVAAGVQPGSRDGKVGIWEYDSTKLLKILTLTASQKITAVKLTPNAEYLFVGTRGGLVEVFDVERQRIVETLRTSEQNHIKCLDVSRDGQYVLAGGYDRFVYYMSLPILLADKSVTFDPAADIPVNFAAGGSKKKPTKGQSGTVPNARGRSRRSRSSF